MRRTLPILFAGVTGHHHNHNERCPNDIGAESFAQSLLQCFEMTLEGTDSNISCVDDNIVAFEGVNPSCLKCVEHFLEDHLMDAISKCNPEYLSSGAKRDSCIASIKTELTNDCY
jgi:hypothetical protein